MCSSYDRGIGLINTFVQGHDGYVALLLKTNLLPLRTAYERTPFSAAPGHHHFARHHPAALASKAEHPL
jgi:hypothetical protein